MGSDEEIGNFSDESEDVEEIGEIDFEELGKKMQHPQSGLKIKTRKWMLKKFPNCFVAEQAVSWICYHQNITDRAEAVSIGRKMQERNIFRHVTNEHKFQDKYL